MCGSEMSLSYHWAWKAFYAVSGLAGIQGVSTALFKLYADGRPVGLNYDRKPALVEDIMEVG